jgi:hypothetical protein
MRAWDVWITKTVKYMYEAASERSSPWPPRLVVATSESPRPDIKAARRFPSVHPYILHLIGPVIASP